MADILTEIIEHKHAEVAAAKLARPLPVVQIAAAKAAPARDMAAALGALHAPRIIAECKRQSPSRGVMLENYDPVRLAQSYERGGAAAVSVLTDEKYFGGELSHLTAVKQAVQIPVLRKDFIVDEYQIYEARAAGADSFLLLSGPLAPAQLEAFLQLGRSLGMEPLIESHTDEELAAALLTSGKILGVNNRNLKDFAVDLNVAKDLLARARKRTPPPLMVCESGIKNAGDVRAMTGAGYHVFLVGESVATSADSEAAVRALVAAGN